MSSYLDRYRADPAMEKRLLERLIAVLAQTSDRGISIVPLIEIIAAYAVTALPYCISLNPHSIAATAPTGAGLDGSPNTEIMGLLKPFSVARYMQRPTTEPDSDQSESEETILVADIDSHLILQIFPARNVIRVFGGEPRSRPIAGVNPNVPANQFAVIKCGWAQPRFAAVDPIRRNGQEIMYVTSLNLIHCIWIESQTCEVLTGRSQSGLQNGGLDEAMWDEPTGMAVSSDGNTIWVCDRKNDTLRAIDFVADSRNAGAVVSGLVRDETTPDRFTKQIPTRARTFPSPDRDSGFVNPRFMVWSRNSKPNTVLYVSCDHSIKRYDTSTGRVSEVITHPPKHQSRLPSFFGMDCTSNELLVTTAVEPHCVYVVDPKTGRYVSIAGRGEYDFIEVPKEPMQCAFRSPTACVLSGDERAVWVADYFGLKIREIGLPDMFNLTELFAKAKPN